MMTEYRPDYGSPRSHEYDEDHQELEHLQQTQSQPSARQQQQLQLQLQQQQQQQQQQRSSTLERGRSIRLMRNGDSFFTGRGFVINQRKYPMLDVFLDDASQALRANFGAVRCIYTPKTGTRLHDISELEDHRTYVAGGGERFKKLHYLDIAEGKRLPNRERRGPPRLPPVRRNDVEGRAVRLSRSENLIIYVYRNGDPLTLPSKILLVKSTLQNWESVLDEITRKVSLSYSAVLKLYAMNGELITSAQQLEYNGMYVAAGKERFKRIEYPDPKSFSPNSSPKMSRKSYTKSDGTNTHTTTATSYGSIDHVGQGRRPVREEFDYFSNKPQQHRRGPTKETDLDRDDGGIYKGRLNHRERVREIDETRDTKVDLPVEHREIETVDEENLYGNAGKTPRRFPQQTGNPPNPTHAVANSRRIISPIRSHQTPPKNFGRDDENDHDDDRSAHNGYSDNREKKSHNGFHDDHRGIDTLVQPGYKQKDEDRDDHHGIESLIRPGFGRKNDEIDDDRPEKSPRNSAHHRVETRQPAHSNRPNENQAATIIQSHVRGYLTRKQVHEKKQRYNDPSTYDRHDFSANDPHDLSANDLHDLSVYDHQDQQRSPSPQARKHTDQLIVSSKPSSPIPKSNVNDDIELIASLIVQQIIENIPTRDIEVEQISGEKQLNDDKDDDDKI